MEKKSKKQVIISVTVLLLVTLTLLGITYAYYRTRIIGNKNDKSISVTSKVLEVTYSDDNAVITANDIEPGDTLTKTFTVSNTGDDTVSYAVIFDNVNNQFMRGEDWTFTLKKGSDVVKSGVIPRTTSYVLTNISIDADVTDTYTLEITYVNSSEDQSEDMGASLSLRVNIADSIETKFDTATSGTLLAAVGNDNLISEPLSIVGEEDNGLMYNSKIGTYISKANIAAANQSSRYITYSDKYTFNKLTGKYTLVDPQVGLYKDIYTNLVGKYVVTISGSTSASVANSSELAMIYQVKEATNEITNTLSYINLSNTGITIEAELASTEDDYGNSYYFRGNVENNYVNFSGMCWRIVRVQGDGKVKLTLADRNHECNSEDYSVDNTDSAYITSENEQFPYNNNEGEAKDLFLYENSHIKTTLNSWLNGGSYTYYNSDGTGTGTFTKKIDDSKLASTEWCNDMSIGKKMYWDAGFNEEVAESEAAITEYYSSIFNRIYGSSFDAELTGPNLKCDFVGLDGTSAVKYSSNIGILTADEIALAGATITSGGNKHPYYLQTNANYYYWTMTPVLYDTDGSKYVVDITESGQYMWDGPGMEAMIRPAIVLASNVTISAGNGTQTNPYVID